MSVEGNNVQSNEEPHIPLKTSFDSIQSLPQEALEMILSHLRYSEICRLGTVCKAFRQAAISIQCSALRSLVPQVLKYMSELYTTTNDDVLTLQEHLQKAFLQTVLLILLGEARMFSATYLRFLQHEPFVNLYPGGCMLDEIYYVLYMVRSGKISRELEPEMSTRLLTKAERFYEMFEEVIEPTLAELYTPAVVTPLSVKLMDALDCCQTSSFRVSVKHNSGKPPFEISGYYELRDFNTLESPPQLGDDVSNETKLRILLHYIRNTVRWNNIFHPLRALWELDEASVRPSISEEMVVQAMAAYRSRCNTITSQLFPSDLITNDNCYGVQQGSTGSGPCHQEFVREIGDILSQSSAFGLTCAIKMSVTDSRCLPTEYEFLIQPNVTNYCSTPGNRYKGPFPSPSSSISVISHFNPVTSTKSSSHISLTAKDTLSRVSEVLSCALKTVNVRARRLDMISKSSNYVEKSVKKTTPETAVKSDPCIHNPVPEVYSSDEVNKIASKLATLRSPTSTSSEEFNTDTRTSVQSGSEVVAVGSSKFNLSGSFVGASRSETQEGVHGQVTFNLGIFDFQLEVRVWRPIASQSNLRSETVIIIKQTPDNSLRFSQDEIVTSHC